MFVPHLLVQQRAKLAHYSSRYGRQEILDQSTKVRAMEEIVDPPTRKWCRLPTRQQRFTYAGDNEDSICIECVVTRCHEVPLGYKRSVDRASLFPLLGQL